MPHSGRQSLNRSHLVQPVRNSSLYAAAVWWLQAVAVAASETQVGGAYLAAITQPAASLPEIAEVEEDTELAEEPAIAPPGMLTLHARPCSIHCIRWRQSWQAGRRVQQPILVHCLKSLAALCSQWPAYRTQQSWANGTSSLQCLPIIRTHMLLHHPGNLRYSETCR